MRGMKRNAVFATLLAMGALACASAPKVEVGWDKNAKFSSYKTWAWKSDDSIRDKVWEKRFRDVLSDQLATDGLKQVDLQQGPDLWAVVHARLSAETQVVSYDPSWGYGWGVWGPSYTEVYQIPVGTILVDLVDTKQKQAVWHGKAHGYISQNKTNEEREQKLISIIAEMFAGYPPATTPSK
jgi:hypothetical protein